MDLNNYMLTKNVGCNDCIFYDYWVDENGPHNLCQVSEDQHFSTLDRCIDSIKFKTL